VSYRRRTCSSQIGSTIKSQTTTEAGFQNQFSYDDYVRRGQVTHHRAHRDHPLRPNPNTRLQYHRGRPPRNPKQISPCASSPSTEPLPPAIPSFPARNLETSRLTILRPRLEIQHLILLGYEQPIVRPVPVLILWVRVGVVRQASEAFVAPDGG
jgi:hypothetical protein